MSPVTQKPILHGRDHGCGGADPIPLICELQGLVTGVTGDPDYSSIQESVFSYPSSGPVDVPIDTWPVIIIPYAEFIEHAAAGDGLYGSWSAEVTGPVYSVNLSGLDDVTDLLGSDDPVSDDGWVSLAAAGIMRATGLGTGGITGDVPVGMEVQPSGIGDLQVRNGELRVWWIESGETEPPSTGGGSLYPGHYPIVNADVATNADIAPTKLSHPGGSSSFLRADGTWATPAAGAPSGSAGGALDGSYPNPGLAASVAGAGLAETSDVLSVNVDGSTLEISSDTLRLKDDGITSAKIAVDAVGSSEIAAASVGSSELADTAVTPGSYGDATHVAQFTVDSDGRLTAAGTVAITATAGDPADDTAAWMPLFDLDGALVLDGDGGLIPTLIPLA